MAFITLFRTIAEPLTREQQWFTQWQESSRKDVERAFGILQQKFQFLVQDVELWYVNDIIDYIYTIVTLHNVMVEEQMKRDEQEQTDWYTFR
jgi:hypothetical protein